MSKEKIEAFLINLFPTFSDYWNGGDTLYRDDDDFYTYHGIWGDFSVYFRDNISNFSDKQLKELFSNVEKWEVKETATFQEWRAGTVDDKQKLSNAVFTCFLECIAGEGFTEKIKLFMGPKSLEYYSHYDH